MCFCGKLRESLCFGSCGSHVVPVWLPCGGFEHAHFTFHGFCFLAGPLSQSRLSHLPAAPTAASLRACLHFLLIWPVLFTWQCGLACLFPSSVGHFVLRCVWNKSLRPGTLPCGQGFGRPRWAPADSSSGGAELWAEARRGWGAPLGPLVGRVCLLSSEPGLPAAPPRAQQLRAPASLSLVWWPPRVSASCCPVLVGSAVASARRSSRVPSREPPPACGESRPPGCRAEADASLPCSPASGPRPAASRLSSLTPLAALGLRPVSRAPRGAGLSGAPGDQRRLDGGSPDGRHSEVRLRRSRGSPGPVRNLAGGPADLGLVLAPPLKGCVRDRRNSYCCCSCPPRCPRGAQSGTPRVLRGPVRGQSTSH